MAERRNASNAARWSSCGQPGKASNELSRKSGESDTRTSPPPVKSVFLFGGDKLPVRIARAGVAGEGPDVLDLGHGFRIAVDHRTGLVSGRRNKLADDAQRDMGLAALHLGRNDIGLVDADEGGLDLFR